MDAMVPCPTCEGTGTLRGAQSHQGSDEPVQGRSSEIGQCPTCKGQRMVASGVRGPGVNPLGGTGEQKSESISGPNTDERRNRARGY